MLPGLATLIRTEAKLVARDTAGLVIPFGLPLLILVMNRSGADPAAGAADAPLDGVAVVVPVSLALIVTMIAVVNMPSFLATYRTTGVLRRLSVTPAHPATVLIAQVVVSIVQAAVGIALALGVAAVAFDLTAPANLGATLGVFALASAALYAIGMLIAAVAPSTNGAIAIGIVAFFAMMALGGAFGPAEALPGPLATIGEHTPFGAAIEGMVAGWHDGSPQTSHLVAMAGTTAAAGSVAAATFRWE